MLMMLGVSCVWLHTILKEGELFPKAKKIKLKEFGSFNFDGEVEPLAMTFSIGIDFQE